MRSVRLGALVIAAVLCFACGRARMLTGQVTAGGEVVVLSPAPTAMMISGGTDQEQLRLAIARALSARGYVLESEDGSHAVARLESRRITLRIALDYSPSQISISYVDSSGLPIEDTYTSRRYQSWIRELTETIEAEIQRPAREAQEAIARAQADQERAVREAREADERELERQSRERIERERLATERAQAEAAAAQARSQPQQVIVTAPQVTYAMPQVQGGVHVTIGGLAFDATRAQQQAGAVVLAPNWAAQTLTGIAGGPISGAQLGFPSGCPGWFQQAPQHTIVLQANVPYVRLEAPSTGDATLAIVAPGGQVWCDDDSAGNLVPMIEGSFPAGVYQIYVGNYRAGEAAQYQLVLSTVTQAGARGYVQPPPVRSGVVVTPPEPNCRSTMIELGQPSTSFMFCDGVDPYCADALLRAGHSPTALMFCNGVPRDCAVQMLRSGRPPTELQFCQ